MHILISNRGYKSIQNHRNTYDYKTANARKNLTEQANLFFQIH